MVKMGIQNQPFVILLLMWCGSNFVVTAIQSNLIFLVENALEMRGVVGQIPIAMLMLVAINFLPFRVWLTRKTGKKTGHMIGLLVLAVF